MRSLSTVLRAACGLVAALVLASPVLAQAPGELPDQTFAVTASDGVRFQAGVWLPAPSADGRPAPLIVISHGNGGWYRGHQDLARALARAGFVVAALTHPGDNFEDQSRATRLTERPGRLSALIDHMTGDWSGPVAIDADRIGAFGFSAGGFTVTAAIGGVSDPQAILQHCRDHPDFFACRLLALQPVDPQSWNPPPADLRIKAAVIAAPAFGFSFTDESLASIRIPVQLWQAADDEILPAPYNVEPIRDRLTPRPDYRRVEGARHYDFLPTCHTELAAVQPALCTSAPGFDRAAFHAGMNREVVDFFRRTLD